MARPRLHIDYETWSDINLITRGSAIYSHRSVPLLLGAKLNDGPTEMFDFHTSYNGGVDDCGDFDPDFSPECPPILTEAIRDGWWIIAHNAIFEYDVTHNSPATRNWPKPKIERLICTQAKARYWGLPSALEKVGRVLALATQKHTEGKRLIQKFCVPQKVGKGKAARTVIRSINPNDPDWVLFRDLYCHDDVETEYGVDCALPDIPERDARAFYLDFRMNQRGFPVNLPAVKAATLFYDHYYKQMDKRFKELSKGLAPTQVAKVKEFLNEQGEDFDNLQSATLRDRLLEADIPPHVREMIEIRAQAAQASVKKLNAFLLRTGADGRARGGFLWYGAHTGRWSGKGIQPQNFPRGIKELMWAITAFHQWCTYITDGNAEVMLAVADLVYFKPLGVLSSALRGFIMAPPGKKFLVVDYAQIELRVLAWLAGAEKTLQRLRDGVDPYKAFAAERMYMCEVEQINSFQRQIAKSALLGAQYQIWIDAFIVYCAKQGIKITKEEATLAILAYRADNPEIVEFWSDLEQAVISAVERKGESRLNNLIIRFEEINGYEWLRIYLPSGRPISYFEPQVRWRTTLHEAKDKEGNIVMGADGQPVMYEKTRQVFSFLSEDGGHTHREYTYGGKLTENVTQGVSYDIMAEGMLIAEEEGYWPIMTVHDEAVTEVDEGFGSVQELEMLVCQLPACYEGLPMIAKGFECTLYRKGD